MKPPAFQFYADDFQSGTIDLTDSEVGLYIRLLCVQWARGGVPNEIDEVMRLSRGSTTLQAERVMRKFDPCEDGMLRNRRMEEERQKQAVWREKSRIGGKNSGVVRSRLNHPSTTLQPPLEPNTQPKVNSPLSTLHSPSNTPPDGFEEFWGLYPRKVDRKKAMSSWSRIKTSDHQRILESVTNRIQKDESWSKEGGKFIPHPTTYLNGRRWEDELEVKKPVIHHPNFTPQPHRGIHTPEDLAILNAAL